MKTKVVVYDNGGETLDRYTIALGTHRGALVFGASERPSSPQGYGQFVGEVGYGIDLGPHLGKKIPLNRTPPEVQRYVERMMMTEAKTPKQLKENLGDALFDTAVDFTKLAVRQGIKANPAVKKIIRNIGQYPRQIIGTKANWLNFKQTVLEARDSETNNTMRVYLKNLYNWMRALEKNFRKDYRYMFGPQGNSSAASEFFSQLAQGFFYFLDYKRVCKALGVKPRTGRFQDFEPVASFYPEEEMYRVSVTYEAYDADGEEIEGDYEYKDAIMDWGELQRAIKEGGFTQFSGRWFSNPDEEIDYVTGERTLRNLHITDMAGDDLDSDTMRRIANTIGIK